MALSDRNGYLKQAVSSAWLDAEREPSVTWCWYIDRHFMKSISIRVDRTPLDIKASGVWRESSSAFIAFQGLSPLLCSENAHRQGWSVAWIGILTTALFFSWKHSGTVIWARPMGSNNILRKSECLCVPVFSSAAISGWADQMFCSVSYKDEKWM